MFIADKGVLLIAGAVLVTCSSAFAPSNPGVACRSTSQMCLRQVAARKAAPITSVTMAGESPRLNNFKKLLSTAALSALLMLPVAAPAKEQLGGTFKILQGASSTQDSGSRRTVTRGAVLDGSDFSGQELAGISFQQSLCRDCKFVGSNLVGASFFDGDLTQANMEGADVSQVNFESTCMKDANLKNAVVHEAYILGSTKLDGIQIEGADFSDTFLRKDQQRYLCKTAKGTNPTTGVDTRDSLMCSQVK